jgi:DNA repair exonuclease SbcCD nuclease subunit
MRFIHAADIHLDSPLTGLSAYEDAPVDLLRLATREAFTNLVNEAISEAVDFVIIAGDLYDGTWKDHNTGIFFVREMGRLKKAGIPVFLLYGNHDAESEMTKRLEMPDNVREFDSRKAVTFKLEELRVALHGRSFKTAATTDNLVPSYPDPVPGMLNIGVLHTALESHEHARYAPCEVAELHAKGYHYWALGHVHSFWHDVHGSSNIVFPGNLQGRHVRETGPKGAVLVTADESGIQRIERLIVDVLRWHSLEVDVSSAQSVSDAARLVGTALDRLLEENTGRPIAARTVLLGKTAAHGELFGMDTQLRAEIAAQAAALGNERLWLEKVKVQTESRDSGDRRRARQDALADLQALLDAADQDPELIAQMKDMFAPLVGKAPFELHAAVPLLKQIREGDLSALIQEVRPGLLDFVDGKE